MGTWGTSISSNDSFQDVYQDFFELYNEGFEPKEITEKLIESYKVEINSEDDPNNFWFALAKAQWECKELDAKIYEKIKLIIDSDSDLIIWKQLDATEKDLNKRKIVLEKFLQILTSEKKNPKARKKKIIRQPHFEKGDCISIKLSNDYYGGLVVLEAIKDTELGLNLIAVTRIHTKTKPTISDFKSGKVLLLDFANWSNRFDIGWCFKISFKKITQEIEIIGNIKVEQIYDPEPTKTNFYYNGSLEKFKYNIEMQMEHEKNNPVQNQTLLIKNLVTKSKWKLW